MATDAPLAVPAALVTATKTDALRVDGDGDALADPGDVVRYTVVAGNAGGSDALGLVFSDTLDANTVLSGTLRASPLALPDVYTATQDTALSVPAGAGLLANDYGLPAPAAAAATGAPTTQGGTLTLNADGSFSYSPPAAFSGTDVFTYTAANSSGTDTASVTLTVLPPPVANDDGYSTVQDAPLTVPAGTGVLVNDTLNGAAIVAYSAASSQGGSLSLSADGSFSYTPPAGFVSPPADTFTYTLANMVASDTAVVSVTVNLPAPPVAVGDA